MKYFLVLIGKDKRSKDILEFDSFAEANALAERMWDDGYEGELPIACAETKEELQRVFSEYRVGRHADQWEWEWGRD